ncbi:MAG TPA: YicC/YloC family endoribonuclease [Candidatus Methylomirabilis sp.]|nr:YicC/YloC family endoribonuclease [Candidatus Methylomirabilis sp.]
MHIRSMTGYAQVKEHVSDQLTISLSLKAVNHRFLDLHLRIPNELDAVETRVRRVLKERLHRGHIEVTLSLERMGGAAFSVNRELVGGYLGAFRQVAEEFGVSAEPDLNAVLKLPGALNAANSDDASNELEQGVAAALEKAIERLNHMREEEGRGAGAELRERMHHLSKATNEVELLRHKVLKAYHEKVQGRMQELIGAHADPDRILQEAAMLAERSDIQEELVRMKNHIQHFLSHLDAGGEVGKKLDFLLQEMNREANTLLSKTTGVAGEALRITELGLAMKSEIEQAKEQVQNIE